LKFRDIKDETESTIAAGQDQALNENYFKKKFWNKEQKLNADYVKNKKK
jgi:hypothetical protein